MWVLEKEGEGRKRNKEGVERRGEDGEKKSKKNEERKHAEGKL